MSWQDRPYAGDNEQPELRINFRRPSTAVVWLIIANVVIYIIDAMLTRGNVDMGKLFGLSLDGLRKFQVWQILTYMFMHAGTGHILTNMLGLYIFGTEFERAFGRQRFLQFYATCGIVGGLAYLILSSFNQPRFAEVPLVGASGAIYGLLVAAIIFFPHVQVVLVIFPMPIRVFGLIMIVMRFLQFINGGIDNPGGEVCHIAGAIAGLGVFYGWGIMPRIGIGSGRGITVLPGSGSRPSRSEGAWARKQEKLAEEQAEVDRILEKVHHHGLQSLTRSERKALNRATQRQREREHEFDRVDRL